MGHKHIFTRLASHASRITGRAPAAILAFTLVFVWALTGPIFGFSNQWQLVVNTGTTIITFLMVFLIQNTQNRDSKALHIKMDELIRVTKGAHTALLDLEELSEEELTEICMRYEKIARESRRLLRRGGNDTATPHVEFAHKTRKKRA